MTGCVSVARVSDFARTTEGLNFQQLSQRDYDQKDALWNEKTGYEYFIEVEKIQESDLVNGATRALKELGYNIQYSEGEHRVIIGERGLRANEWRSVAGVYYRPKEAGFQIYIRNKITQDITGGWRDNRAKKIAQAICEELKSCIDPRTKK